MFSLMRGSATGGQLSVVSLRGNTRKATPDIGKIQVPSRVASDTVNKIMQNKAKQKLSTVTFQERAVYVFFLRDHMTW